MKDLVQESLLDSGTRTATMEYIINDREVHERNLTFLMGVTFGADFADSDDERVYVAKATLNQLVTGIVSMTAVYTGGRDIAERCLISLSFFEEELCRRTGASSSDYYRNLGIYLFNKCREWSVAKNFDRWRNHLYKKLGKKMNEKKFRLPTYAVTNSETIAEYDDEGKCIKSREFREDLKFKDGNNKDFSVKILPKYNKCGGGGI